MGGFGYVPVCSSSSAVKTYIIPIYGITAPFFREILVKWAGFFL
jgi:hypothetical protein